MALRFRLPRYYVPPSTAPSRRREPMPDKFHPLATYNAEVARGIVHTAGWDARMAELQEEFWQWQQASA